MNVCFKIIIDAKNFIKTLPKTMVCFIKGHDKEPIGFRELSDWTCKRCEYVCPPYERIDNRWLFRLRRKLGG